MDRNGSHCLGKQVRRHCKANNTDPHLTLEIGSWPQRRKEWDNRCYQRQGGRRIGRSKVRGPKAEVATKD